jgi:Fe2+ or Zn2+ uptake regulation protein
MNLKEIFKILSREGYEIKYPESVYKALELLVDVGLVDKSYDRQKGLLYGLACAGITVDFSEL